MDHHDTAGRARGNSFVKGITTVCALGTAWLVIVLVYAAWVGVHG